MMPLRKRVEGEKKKIVRYKFLINLFLFFLFFHLSLGVRLEYYGLVTLNEHEE